jgi:hypothetical protein
MALKKFEEYAKDFNSKNEDSDSFKTIQSPKVNTLANSVSEKAKVKDLKSSPVPTPAKKVDVPQPKVTTKKLNENSFLVGADYKVKVVIDVPQALVQEYIDKVKEETDKDPLDNFSEAEVAEQIITFLIKKNLVIDNLTPEFTVGTENVGSTEKTQSSVEGDAEELSNDLGVDDGSDDADGEIEFKDFNEGETDNSEETVSDEDTADGEIEFDDKTEEKSDLGEEREVVKDEDSDPDSNFEEIEFADNNQDDNNKTIGDLKKSQGQSVEKKHEEETSSEEEEEIEDLYKKIGYKVGYYEKINIFKK